MHSSLVSGIQDILETIAAAVHRAACSFLDRSQCPCRGLTYSACPAPSVVPGTTDWTFVKQLLGCPLPARLIMEKDSP